MSTVTFRIPVTLEVAVDLDDEQIIGASIGNGVPIALHARGNVQAVDILRAAEIAVTVTTAEDTILEHTLYMPEARNG